MVSCDIFHVGSKGLSGSSRESSEETRMSETKNRGPGEALDFLEKEHSPAKAPLVWVQVGLTADEWEKKAGGCIAHQGTLIRTEAGVYSVGLIGTIFLGKKKDDGSVDMSGMNLNAEPYHNEVIIEYSDPPGMYPNECYRLETGAIHCECDEDP